MTIFANFVRRMSESGCGFGSSRYANDISDSRWCCNAARATTANFAVGLSSHY